MNSGAGTNFNSGAGQSTSDSYTDRFDAKLAEMELIHDRAQAKENTDYGWVPLSKIDSNYAAVLDPWAPQAVDTRAQYKLGAATKFDSGKRDWSLLPLDSVEEIVKVLEFGANKYAAHNWSSNGGFKYTRVLNATLRHVFAFMRGEDNDPETGLSHLAHAGCNILFILHFIKHKDKYNTNDDRNL